MNQNAVQRDPQHAQENVEFSWEAEKVSASHVSASSPRIDQDLNSLHLPPASLKDETRIQQSKSEKATPVERSDCSISQLQQELQSMKMRNTITHVTAGVLGAIMSGVSVAVPIAAWWIFNSFILDSNSSILATGCFLGSTLLSLAGAVGLAVGGTLAVDGARCCFKELSKNPSIETSPKFEAAKRLHFPEEGGPAQVSVESLFHAYVEAAEDAKENRVMLLKCLTGMLAALETEKLPAKRAALASQIFACINNSIDGTPSLAVAADIMLAEAQQWIENSLDQATRKNRLSWIPAAARRAYIPGTPQATSAAERIYLLAQTMYDPQELHDLFLVANFLTPSTSSLIGKRVEDSALKNMDKLSGTARLIAAQELYNQKQLSKSGKEVLANSVMKVMHSLGADDQLLAHELIKRLGRVKPPTILTKQSSKSRDAVLG